jgi:uncharacterized protein YcbK (DUF882 family)
MATRRQFLQRSAALTTLGALALPPLGCASPQPTTTVKSASAAKAAANKSAAVRTAPKTAAAPMAVPPAPTAELAPPPDIFDAQALDLEFWLRPRTLSLTRPASNEKATLLYWKDGEIIDSAYQELCHLMRDVSAKEVVAIDPKLFETLWGTQAFIARYGMEHPLEILSGYRTAKSNTKLIEAGVPAARQSLHIDGKAADIRIANLNAEVLGGLVKSFRQGGVGFYYRDGPRGGWIHADTGLKRTWKG